MKEFDEISKLIPDKQIIAEINKEYTLKGSMKKKCGLILFVVDFDNRTVEPAVIHTTVAIDAKTGKPVKKHKVNMSANQNALYVFAINKGRALYKAFKMVREIYRRNTDKI